VTAFLYVGLGGRPFWNTAIIAPRFLASAFAAGPALIILTVQVIRWATGFRIAPGAIDVLRRIVTVALTINMFLLGCEVFTEFYTGSAHLASTRYLFFGLHGHYGLVAWIWSALALNGIAMVILYLPRARRPRFLNVACVCMFIGIWIEKGMGLIIPAFIPSPLGEIVEYVPTINETKVCLGIWAFGLLLYTIFVRITVPVLTGRLVEDAAPASTTSPTTPSTSLDALPEG
jgi:molybdopterin-containing oxidoreductase family membrane subunit